MADPARRSPSIKILIEGLHERGWTEGRNLELIWRTAEGHHDRLGPIMDEVIRMPVDVIIAFGPGVEEALKRTSTIPVVMSATGALPETRARNLTGTAYFADPGLFWKRLLVLKALAGGSGAIAFAHDRQRKSELDAETLEQARQAGVQLTVAPYDFASPAPGLDAALAKGARSIYLAAEPGSQRPENQQRVHDWALRNKIPVLHAHSTGARTGGLVSYGSELPPIYQRTAHYVDRILRGTPPSELPIERPAVIKLIVNRRVARAMGLEIPGALLLQADEVID